MYSHTIYIPIKFKDIIAEVEMQLSRAYGGCTSTINVGKWLDDMKMVEEETVMTINCINGYTHEPACFIEAADQLKQQGEESVLITRQEIKSCFV